MIKYYRKNGNNRFKIKTFIITLLIDIDFFKNYNDYYGHLQGDECLKKVADQLKKELEKKILFVGLVEKEFVVLLPSNTNGDYAFSKAEKVRMSVENLRIRHEFSDV
ncbi:diguanylate cyclase [Anaerobacillus sp. HL2]|nr:diguanylate cyclase [Anaerobacillus sp. HL2]